MLKKQGVKKYVLKNQGFKKYVLKNQGVEKYVLKTQGVEKYELTHSVAEGRLDDFRLSGCSRVQSSRVEGLEPK